ncbi:9276_t:CDS:10 [Ambispora leptoticha]|uniref:9276_t:CDS:1 n=1 Tax=Ambispora leptoticha TaxID=144679 RepID=A0A9N8YP50_9GLOM|nr:9276_t:CDS:10 [Ambispora leptoticha]
MSNPYTWRNVQANPYAGLQAEELDPESLEAEAWREEPPPREEQLLEEDEANAWRENLIDNAPRNNNPDDFWLKIEIWGTRTDIDQAIKQWNSLATNLLYVTLTDKQKKKLERRKKREEDMKTFQGFCIDKKPYNGFFMLPDDEIPIETLIGKKEEILHPVRAETNCYMWYEHGENILQVSGDSRENVDEATMRIRNLYLKIVAFRSIPKLKNKDDDEPPKCRGWSSHVIEYPQTPLKVKIVMPPPKHLKLPYDAQGQLAVLEAVTYDEEKKLNQLEEDYKKVLEKVLEEKNKYMLTLQSNNASNLAMIEKTLLQGLRIVHLFDEEIKMRVRFGHVILTDFPKTPLWNINKLNERIMRDSRFHSKFATCIADNLQTLQPLFEVLSENNIQQEVDALSENNMQRENEVSSENNTRWTGSPFVEYKIRTKHVKNWDYTFDVQFKKDDKIGLWNVVTNEKHIIDINVACLENDYSWRISLDAAKRVSNDKHSPQGLFVYRLRLSPSKRLIYTNNDEIRVISVCKKTKWKHWWNTDYIVEVTRYELWDCHANKQTGVEITLDLDEPINISYGVTLYRKSWDDDFACNCNLKVGEAPEWHPNDILDRDKPGGLNKLLNEIREFLKILEEKVPFSK